MKCLFLASLVLLITFAHSHSEEEIQRGKEKWFKKPENIGTGHDHHGHNHHGHDHHGHDHHGHDHHGHGHHHKHDHGPDHHHSINKLKNRSFTQTIDMWWQAIGATLAISAFPFFILHFVPLENNAAAYQPMLKVLLSFASGGLLGDAFLHLIPHAISPHSHGEEDGHHHHHHHEESHDHGASTMVGMWVMAGILAFLCVEKVVRLLQGGEGHCHHHESPATESKTQNLTKSSDKKSETSVRKRKPEEKASGDEVESEEKAKEEQVKDEIPQMAVSGYLNLAADFFHNFTDGLAIGASFLGGQKLGMITTLTILFHEIPHEIGDFAILVQSGCDKKKAMWLQLSTATGAMLGCIIGLLAENVGEVATSWILPFTAGGFIYIATVSVIPELLKDASDFKQTCKEIFAMLFGIFMMVIIAFLEEH